MSQLKDGNLFLIFPSLYDAIQANLKIYENITRTLAVQNRGGNLYNADTDTEDAEASVVSGAVVLSTYPIIGLKESIEQKTSGLTEVWTAIWERQDVPGSYVLSKPIDTYMTDVSGYTSIESRNTAWYPTSTEA